MRKLFLPVFIAISMSLFISNNASAISLESTPPPANDKEAVTDNSAAPAGNEEVQKAIQEFKSLSKHERKERMKDVKKAWKKYRSEKREGKETSSSAGFFAILFAILIPPLGVYLKEGEITNHFWIDLLLTFLFFLPGMIYALVIVLS